MRVASVARDGNGPFGRTQKIKEKPMRGIESLVLGMIVCTMFMNTVRESKMVTPAKNTNNQKEKSQIKNQGWHVEAAKKRTTFLRNVLTSFVGQLNLFFGNAYICIIF